jgi:hypothetical protein
MPSTGARLPGAHAVERATVLVDIGRGSPGGIIGGAVIRGPVRPGCAWVRAPPVANPGTGERDMTIDSGPAPARAGGAARETAVDAAAPLLGRFTRGIAAAKMVGRNRGREVGSLSSALGLWPKSCRQVSVATPALW